MATVESAPVSGSHSRTRSISTSFKRGLRRPLSIIASASSGNLRDLAIGVNSSSSSSTENYSSLDIPATRRKPRQTDGWKRRSISALMPTQYAASPEHGPPILQPSPQNNTKPTHQTHSRILEYNNTPRTAHLLPEHKDLPPPPPIIPRRSTSRNFTPPRAMSAMYLSTPKPAPAVTNTSNSVAGRRPLTLLSPTFEEDMGLLPAIDSSIGQWISADELDYTLQPKPYYNHSSHNSTDSTSSSKFSSFTVESGLAGGDSAKPSPQQSTFSAPELQQILQHQTPTQEQQLAAPINTRPKSSGVYLGDDGSLLSPTSLTFSCASPSTASSCSPHSAFSSSTSWNMQGHAAMSVFDEDFNPFLEDEPTVKQFRSEVTIHLT